MLLGVTTIEDTAALAGSLTLFCDECFGISNICFLTNCRESRLVTYEYVPITKNVLIGLLQGS